jgi:hypothetical protein
VRAKEIRGQMYKDQEILRKGIGFWEENWGGFSEMRFPIAKTKVLKVEFDRPAIFIDELQVFGPADYNKNLALASTGTKLVEDEAMKDEGSPAWKANDGQFGTMVWKAKAGKGSKIKPWVEIHFTDAREVSRFRFSSNREYYFETDYLEKNGDGSFPGVRISALQDDSSWVELADSKMARQKLMKNGELKNASKRLHDNIVLLGEVGPQHSFVGAFQKPVVTHVFHRGSPENPRDEVVPAGFDVINGDLGLTSEAPDAERRLAFAKWVTNPEHPLTARVMVNRIWHHIFGAGIVPTAADFGAAGALPSHPELLDWLAAEFVSPKSGDSKPWVMKAMIRRLVMTDAFRRSSEPVEASENKDAGSAYLWRYAPQRVEAEVIRDGILQASGKLDPAIGGRSYRIHNVKKTYAQWEVTNNHGENSWRRLIYQERMRRVDDRIFTAFDFPDCGQVRAERPVSTTPLQALNLMNSDFVVEQSKFIAERALSEVKGDATAAIKRCFELMLTREPYADELAACEGVDLELVCRTLINSNEFAFLP